MHTERMLQVESQKAENLGATLGRLFKYFKPYLLALILAVAFLGLGTWAQVTAPELIGQAVDCYISPAIMDRTEGSQMSQMMQQFGIESASQLGIMEIPENLLIDYRDIDSYPPEQVAMITTGSQGEPYSALSLMATNAHKFIRIQPGDTVIFSSRFIPGNGNAKAPQSIRIIVKQLPDYHTYAPCIALN